MRIYVDFDGTIVRSDMPESEILDSEPEFLSPEIPDLLRAIKRAGHTLVLWSRRASKEYRAKSTYNEQVFQQMLIFVDTHLPDVFDEIDEDKPNAHLFFDDRSHSKIREFEP